jgi:hypothetical protein
LLIMLPSRPDHNTSRVSWARVQRKPREIVTWHGLSRLVKRDLGFTTTVRDADNLKKRITKAIENKWFDRRAAGNVYLERCIPLMKSAKSERVRVLARGLSRCLKPFSDAALRGLTLHMDDTTKSTELARDLQRFSLRGATFQSRLRSPSADCHHRCR